MSKPTRDDWGKLKRIARYLFLHPRAIYKYRFQRRPSYLDVYSDSNWAGCLKTRKSSQGGVCMFGGHCIRSWSVSQGAYALGSAEADFYAIAEGVNPREARYMQVYVTSTIQTANATRPVYHTV